MGVSDSACGETSLLQSIREVGEFVRIRNSPSRILREVAEFVRIRTSPRRILTNSATSQIDFYFLMLSFVAASTTFFGSGAAATTAGAALANLARTLSIAHAHSSGRKKLKLPSS